MRIPTSSSPNRSPEIYKEEIKARIQKQHLAPKPDQAEILKAGNEKLADVIRYLESFDVGSIQRRSDPRIKELIVRINDTIAEIFHIPRNQLARRDLHFISIAKNGGGGRCHLAQRFYGEFCAVFLNKAQQDCKQHNHRDDDGLYAVVQE